MTEAQVALIKRIVSILSDLGLEYFLVGATARNLLFEKQKLDGLRKTNDWDFAVRMESWSEYDKLIKTLLKEGFVQGRSIHTIIYDELVVDIVPFGKIEDGEGKITFPEPSGNVMSMIGFKDFLEMTEEVDFHGIKLKIGSYEALLGSKIFAWNDRKKKDDATDIRTLLSNYEALSQNDFYDEIAEDGLPFTENFDSEEAKAYLAGRSLGRSLSEPSRKQTLDILDTWLKEVDPEIARTWGPRPLDNDENSYLKEKKLLKQLRDGLSLHIS